MAWQVKHIYCRYVRGSYVVKWIEKQPFLQTPAPVTLLINSLSESESTQIG